MRAFDGALLNPASGKCLDDPGSSTANGTQVQIYTCSGAANQSWMSPAGGGGTTGATGATGAISGYGGLCLDVRSANNADGTPVQVYTCNGTGAQKWTVAANGTIQALGKCLDVTGGGTANGTLADLYTCNGTGAQVWQPQAGGAILNPQSGRCLDDTGWSTTPGTQVQIWACTGGEPVVEPAVTRNTHGSSADAAGIRPPDPPPARPPPRGGRR